MSYGDARQNRTLTIGAVVVVHAALGYALMTGLATSVIKKVAIGPLETYAVPETPPPPPDPQPLPRTDTVTPRSTQVVVAPKAEVPTPTDLGLVVTSIELPPITADEGPMVPIARPAPSPTVSLARGATPRGNQGDWFPPDSYPAAAQRANAEGLVSVRVTVGTDGRVSDCAVTVSSGNADLDGATCRLARRNGRFEPARDADGKPVASSATLRNVRWRLDD